jgi:prevent-host-death family protein
MFMKTVNIGELKDNLSRYLSEVRQGGSVLVKDRNKPIARIVPLSWSEDDEESELAALAAEGKVSFPVQKGGLPEQFFKAKLPSIDRDAARMLIEDRDAR